MFEILGTRYGLKFLRTGRARSSALRLIACEAVGDPLKRMKGFDPPKPGNHIHLIAFEARG